MFEEQENISRDTRDVKYPDREVFFFFFAKKKGKKERKKHAWTIHRSSKSRNFTISYP